MDTDSIYIYIYINTYVYIVYNITSDNHLLTGVDSSHCSVASNSWHRFEADEDRTLVLAFDNRYRCGANDTSARQFRNHTMSVCRLKEACTGNLSFATIGGFNRKVSTHGKIAKELQKIRWHGRVPLESWSFPRNGQRGSIPTIHRAPTRQ